MADVARKLLVTPGDRVLVAGGPEDAAALIGQLPDGAQLVTSGAAEITLQFAADSAAFNAAIPDLRNHAAGARAAWIAYPKLSSKAAGTLSRDVIRTTLEDSTDITPVTQIALDETWSALRVRPKDRVGRQARPTQASEPRLVVS